MIGKLNIPQYITTSRLLRVGNYYFNPSRDVYIKILTLDEREVTYKLSRPINGKMIMKERVVGNLRTNVVPVSRLKGMVEVGE